MGSKTQIVAELGQAELLLTDRIARSLLANDQTKYYFALLQSARSNADRPATAAPDLKTERLACQIEDAWLDGVIAGAVRQPGKGYAISGAREIVGRIGRAVETMISCLPQDQRVVLAERQARVQPPVPDADVVPGELIDRMTSGNAARGDSLHLLVMDAHRAINRLQAETAVETLDGASVHNLSKRSRRMVQAFMSGLNRTAPLKFDHPGLGTTAAEHEGRLLIQNDIGTTDAHVLVVRVSELTATLTYTDIHERRLKFFQSLFSKVNVRWENVDTRSSRALESRSYLLATGTFDAADEGELADYLAHLGSRIVFLIDWNKMRKRLRAFVSRDCSIRVLTWAADNDIGHRGMLEVGGERALAEAIEYAAGEQLRYGDRLDTLIGEHRAEEFLKAAFAIASRGLRQLRSRRIIADEIRSELKRHFESSRLAIFALASRHAALGFDLAVTLREALEYLGRGAAGALPRFAERAMAWEAKADALLNCARDDIRRFDRPPALLQFFQSADDAIDELEEAASLLGLIELVPAPKAPLDAVRRLGDAALACSQELVKCIECAATITSSDVRDDLDDFLRSLDRLIDLEHRADALMREARRALVTEVESPRTLYLVDLVAQALETATDAYAHSGQALRGYLMEEVLA